MKLFEIEEVIELSKTKLEQYKKQLGFTDEQLRIAVAVAKGRPARNYEGLRSNSFVLEETKHNILRNVFGADFDMRMLENVLRGLLIIEVLEQLERNSISTNYIFQTHCYEIDDALCEIHTTFFVQYYKDEEDGFDDDLLWVSEINPELWCYAAVQLSDWKKRFPQLSEDVKKKLNEI